MTSLALIKKFRADCFKITFLRKAESAVRFVIKFWFGDLTLQK